MPENEARGLSTMGATFAERKAAREGAERPVEKQVDGDAAEAENKAVGASETKRPTRKKS